MSLHQFSWFRPLWIIWYMRDEVKQMGREGFSASDGLILIDRLKVLNPAKWKVIEEKYSTYWKDA